MFLHKMECFSPKQVEDLSPVLTKDNNPYICETAGFIPLEVKLKQFEQNGLVAQFMVSDFDSNDYRDIYLNPDFNVSPEDDFEDIQEKLAAQRQYAEEIKQSKSTGMDVKVETEIKAGTEEPLEKNPPSADKEE